MSKRVGKYGIIFTCNCGDETGDEYSDFYEAWNDAQREGWSYNGADEHICPSCKGEDWQNDSQW